MNARPTRLPKGKAWQRIMDSKVTVHAKDVTVDVQDVIWAIGKMSDAAVVAVVDQLFERLSWPSLDPLWVRLNELHVECHDMDGGCRRSNCGVPVPWYIKEKKS